MKLQNRTPICKKGRTRQLKVQKRMTRKRRRQKLRRKRRNQKGKEEEEGKRKGKQKGKEKQQQENNNPTSLLTRQRIVKYQKICSIRGKGCFIFLLMQLCNISNH